MSKFTEGQAVKYLGANNPPLTYGAKLKYLVPKPEYFSAENGDACAVVPHDSPTAGVFYVYENDLKEWFEDTRPPLEINIRAKTTPIPQPTPAPAPAQDTPQFTRADIVERLVTCGVALVYARRIARRCDPSRLLVLCPAEWWKTTASPSHFLDWGFTKSGTPEGLVFWQKVQDKWIVGDYTSWIPA